MFFDNRELEKVDESHENAKEILDLVKEKTFTPADESKTRICPCCEANMTVNGAADGEIKIDVCNWCGGKFLDHGDLQKIREHIQKPSTITDSTVDSMFKQTMTELFGSLGNNPKPSPVREFVTKLIINML